MTRLAPVILAMVVVISSGRAMADQLVDDFENPAGWSAWSFSNGPECPGAAGSLDRIAGAGRNGSTAARLRFDFTGGGCHVGARRSLEGFSARRGISFWLAGAVPGTRLFVWLTDETGQVFETYLPMQSCDSRRWVRYRILAAGGGRWWGGAADGVFHGGATALEILLDVGYGVHRTGEIFLDDVTALSGSRFRLDPFAAAADAPVLFRGRLHDRLGVNVNLASLSTSRLDRAAAAGFGWVRTDMAWAQVEQVRGSYDFAPYDALVDAVEARGMHALLILDYFNPLYCRDPGCDEHTGPVTDTQQNAFAAFAAAAAAHFDGRAVSLEVWNEPNSTSFWRPEPDPAAYGRLAAKTLAAVREASARVPVIVGVTAGVDVDFLDAALAAADLSRADGISVHPYRSFEPESIGEDMALLRETVAARTGRHDIPVISGEWGYTTLELGGSGPEALQRQAVAAVRELLSAQLYRLPLAIWYDLTDDCGDPTEWECNFGLLWDDGTTPKPAWNAVAAMNRIVPGGKVQVSDCGQPPAVYCLAFRGTNGTVAALWSGQEGTQVTVQLPGSLGVDVLDLFGAPAGGTVFVGRELTLREEDGPVYLRVQRRPRRSKGRLVPARLQ
ncbi:MAG: cellulase family glycosylhydrolase [Acidobacteria bacterium]|nr:cellulase family glycosylhydrolase [Acidobacteriota bacterium]